MWLISDYDLTKFVKLIHANSSGKSYVWLLKLWIHCIAHDERKCTCDSNRPIKNIKGPTKTKARGIGAPNRCYYVGCLLGQHRKGRPKLGFKRLQFSLDNHKIYNHDLTVAGIGHIVQASLIMHVRSRLRFICIIVTLIFLKLLSHIWAAKFVRDNFFSPLPSLGGLFMTWLYNISNFFFLM